MLTPAPETLLTPPPKFKILENTLAAGHPYVSFNGFSSYWTSSCSHINHFSVQKICWRPTRSVKKQRAAMQKKLIGQFANKWTRGLT